VASPFACYVTRAGDGTFTWDLRVLETFEHHPGLRSLGTVVTFERGAGNGRLAAVRIDSDAGSYTQSDPQWPLARRLAMTAASTHLSIVRHFGYIHLAAGGPLAVVTRNELPPDHPLRRLLWPHVYATQYSNDLITEDQLAPGGDFEGMFSLTHRGVCALIDATIDGFDFGTIDPDVDALRRGLGDLATPSIDNRRQHHAVFLAHARRYLERYYDDDRIAADEAVQAWRAELAKRVPGTERVTGPAVGVEGVTRLTAAIMQLAAVEHEILGSGMWDYQLWTDAVPARVPADGTRPPVDVYQRLVNANFNLNVHRTALLSDFSDLALDAAGAEAFRTFRADLLALQAQFDASPSEPWRMEPKRLKANINA
jgi:arachidonate 15-lipoxygenase